MSQDQLKNFKALLDSQHAWPCEYLFKFIVSKDSAQRVGQLFEGNKISFRESAQGNYVSLSIKMQMESSDQVLVVYENAAKIPGVIAL